MQREWTDPRDRRTWLVTLAPIGLRRSPETSSGVRGERSVAFHRRGQHPRWTRVTEFGPLDLIDDQRLMDLLDLASTGFRTPPRARSRVRDAIVAPVPPAQRVR